MIILARICGKMGVNPNLVLSRLANSRYSQFSGLGQNLSPSRMIDDIDYASELVYNWNEIKSRNENFLEEEKRTGKLPDLSSKKTNLDALKEQLKEKLRQSQQPLEEAKEEIKKKQK